jgi:hypothetical protein
MSWQAKRGTGSVRSAQDRAPPRAPAEKRTARPGACTGRIESTAACEIKRARTSAILRAFVAREGLGLIVRLVPANLERPPCEIAIDVARRNMLATHAPPPPFANCSAPAGCVCLYRHDG